MYEDPQLQDNPTYGVSSTAIPKEVNGEETYETCFQ